MALIDRQFPSYARGEIRNLILEYFRNNLRSLVDPATGQAFTEETIRRATMPRSRFYVEADAIDVVGLAFQRRGDFLAQQVNPARASGPFLLEFHGGSRGLGLLPATGGSGFASGEAPDGTTFQGSTIIPDETAAFANDEAGNQYQVLITATADSNDEYTVALQAVSKGAATNLVAGSKLRWANPPVGANPEFTVDADFTGGFDAETEGEFQARLLDLIGAKAKAGNAAHFRYWSRRASNAVADAFVYPCALRTGSTLVCVVQKRGSVAGPLGRMPSVGTLTTVRGFIIPPASGEVPAFVHVVASPWQSDPVDMAATLSMRRKSTGGWEDLNPWPRYTGGFGVQVVGAPAPTQTVFHVVTSAAPVSLANAPEMMIWDPDKTAFERLSVASVSYNGGNDYTVTLNAPGPARTITPGDLISPYTRRAPEISAAVVSYFDSLGPGEVVDVSVDLRAARARRRVEPAIRSPYWTGSEVMDFLKDALGTSLSRGVLSYSSKTTPSLPATISDGPYMLTPRRFAVYDLE